MPRYGVSFDLDTARMVSDGYSKGQIINNIYGSRQNSRSEIRRAMQIAGYCNEQRSGYTTNEVPARDHSDRLDEIRSALHQYAPTFCRYVRSIHLYELIDETTTIRNDALPGILQPRRRPTSA